MKIAIFSGLDGCHYEMFGYIIYFCMIKKYNLTIYCHTTGDIGFISFYNNFFYNYDIKYKELSLFEVEKHNYDNIFLTTDDDSTYNRNDLGINNKTIAIEHHYSIRCPAISNRIATRPFDPQYYRNWALATYPILNANEKKQKIINNDTIQIMLVGFTKFKFDIDVINRIKSIGKKKIVINAASRQMIPDFFIGTDESVEVNIFKNIPATEFFDILCQSNYVLTDVSDNTDHTKYSMSGILPSAFSTLTPLIISRETNSYYQFKNVIEFDKNSNDSIVLQSIDIESLEKERDELIKKNHELFDSIIVN